VRIKFTLFDYSRKPKRDESYIEFEHIKSFSISLSSFKTFQIFKIL